MTVLTLADVSITLQAQYDDTPVRGNCIASGDDAFDKKVEDSIIRRLDNGDVWAWAAVKVTATPTDPRLSMLEASDYLGGCSYKNVRDFVKSSGYYEDMVQTCLDDLNKQLSDVAAALGVSNA